MRAEYRNSKSVTSLTLLTYLKRPRDAPASKKFGNFHKGGGQTNSTLF